MTSTTPELNTQFDFQIEKDQQIYYLFTKSNPINQNDHLHTRSEYIPQLKKKT